MKITCFAVGKIKEKYYTEAVKEYAKRLSRYCKLELIELPDEKTPDGASQAEEAAILEREGERILKALKEDAYVIALAIEGKALDSVEFSRKPEQLGVRGKSHIAFVFCRAAEGSRGRKLFVHDLSTPVDACDFTGAGVSRVSDYERRALS